MKANSTVKPAVRLFLIKIGLIILRFTLSKTDESNCSVREEKKSTSTIKKIPPTSKTDIGCFPKKKNPDKFQSKKNFVELLT